MPLCRPLGELRRTDEPLFGGKSTGLGELIAAGLPVPPGFAVAGIETLSDAVRVEVEQSYAALSSPPVAVRSSAIGEDSEQATFAGQLESYLWVKGPDELWDAVRRCHASLYSDTAVAYRHHFAGGAAAVMGITVQRMVDAAVSGVMFTCNPVSGDPSMVAINASWGLGLAVVGGEVTPDDYLVSKVTGEIVRETIASKDVQYLSGARRTEVPPQQRAEPCLDPEAIARLVDLARRAERHFGRHQDIEWAIDQGGELFLLQSRPVTAIADRVAKPPPTASALELVMRKFGA